VSAHLTPSSPPVRRRRWTALLVSSLLLVAASCSEGSPDASSGDSNRSTEAAAGRAGDAPTVAPVSEPGTFGVGSLTETLVDPSRVTKAFKGYPELPQRTLPVTVYYPADGPPADVVEPDAPVATDDGPFPLLVFGHGVNSNGAAYEKTLATIASAGYVVSAPTFPLGNRNTPGGAGIEDMDQQALDIPFVIDQQLAASAEPTGPLSGRIDPERVGIFGHSMGAVSTMAAGLQVCCRHEAVDAVAEWAGILLPLGGDDNDYLDEEADDRPVLIVHGDKDATVSYENAPAIYDLVRGPKYLLTLLGEGHSPPFQGGTGSPAGSLATLATIDFFDRYLKDDPGGTDRIEAAVAAAPGLATLQAAPG
jgi:fermentation-respiration switch protein FrsA (DUF1100 family)